MKKKNQGILTFSLQGESYLMGEKKKKTHKKLSDKGQKCN